MERATEHKCEAARHSPCTPPKAETSGSRARADNGEGNPRSPHDMMRIVAVRGAIPKEAHISSIDLLEGSFSAQRFKVDVKAVITLGMVGGKR
eukprot:5552259-Alexandrium_andersonii.AAC.1